MSSRANPVVDSRRGLDFISLVCNEDHSAKRGLLQSQVIEGHCSAIRWLLKFPRRSCKIDVMNHDLDDGRRHCVRLGNQPSLTRPSHSAKSSAAKLRLSQQACTQTKRAESTPFPRCPMRLFNVHATIFLDIRAKLYFWFRINTMTIAIDKNGRKPIFT